MSNLLIVESKNDELFIRAVIEHLNLPYIQVDKHPICHINGFECMEGLNSKKLEERLTALKNQLHKKEVEAIGIILDHDGKREERINLINEAVNSIFETDENILETGKFISVNAKVGNDNFSLKIACYLMNVNENGELETVLKFIKSKDSPYADCLDNWRNCVENRLNASTSEEKQKILSDKEFDKFWLNNYIRFDTCSNREKKQAARKCSIRQFEYILENKKDIFDFDNPILNDFKKFLRLFQ